MRWCRGARMWLHIILPSAAQQNGIWNISGTYLKAWQSLLQMPNAEGKTEILSSFSFFFNFETYPTLVFPTRGSPFSHWERRFFHFFACTVCIVCPVTLNWLDKLKFFNLNIFSCRVFDCFPKFGEYLSQINIFQFVFCRGRQSHQTQKCYKLTNTHTKDKHSNLTFSCLLTL